MTRDGFVWVTEPASAAADAAFIARYSATGQLEVATYLGGQAHALGTEWAFDSAEAQFLRLRKLLETTSPASRELLICLDNYAAVLRKQQREDEEPMHDDS